MQPHDFLRQAIIGVAKHLKEFPELFEKEYISDSISLLKSAKEAVKFVMPTDGKLFDTKLAGLSQDHRLPYERILIEYECKSPGGMASEVFGERATRPANKRIVFAEQYDQTIAIASIVSFKDPYGNDVWTVQPYISEIIPANLAKGAKFEAPEGINTPVISQFLVDHYDMGGHAERTFGDAWKDHAYFDMLDEVNCVLNLMEALSCRNVTAEQLPVKNNKLAQRKKGALPYDLYHVLVVNSRSGEKSTDQGGSHRSPREHIRRGHIRRLPSGNIWVNSTIVNHGNHGKVHKVYALEAA
jgi:hypothetical protein